MKICFPNRAVEAEFSELRRLERRFGAHVAARIVTRIGLLMAAKHLAEVPTKPPIRLRTFDTQTGQFTVDLGGSKRLRFRAYAQRNASIAQDAVEEIEVLGVD